MGDFGQVGPASLWKSGPLFSTTSKEAELMHDELRLNPQATVARLGPRSSDALGRGGGASMAPVCPQDLQSRQNHVPQE